MEQLRLFHLLDWNFLKCSVTEWDRGGGLGLGWAWAYATYESRSTGELASDDVDYNLWPVRLTHFETVRRYPALGKWMVFVGAVDDG